MRDSGIRCVDTERSGSYRTGGRLEYHLHYALCAPDHDSRACSRVEQGIQEDAPCFKWPRSNSPPVQTDDAGKHHAQPGLILIS
jgi:hypothetical protein